MFLNDYLRKLFDTGTLVTPGVTNISTAG
jgi:hypothetical protein